MRVSPKAMLCSKLAIATALVVGATPAMAQGVNGTVTGSTGINAPVNSGNTTTIDVTGQQAVINWNANGPSNGSGLTTFQDSTQTLTFQGSSNFAVLNRVAPTVSTDAIYMNGTVNSLVGEQSGGTVYFYSANGIVMGDNARINVGSLGLTTSNIADDGQGNWMTDFDTANPSVTFSGALAGSYVRIDSLAEVGANGAGNYVALVAPQVVHRGTIRTDGGAALVGASAATITFRTDNLYDIVVTTGSSDTTGVIVDGGTIERNSQAIGADHRAYLVAVPANNAMTMLVQGGANLGFDIAGSAGVEGNAVVLSAGRNVFNGEDVGPPNTLTSSITIDNAGFTSDVVAHASDSIQVSSWNGATSFSGSLNASASGILSVQATQNAMTIGGDLAATADNIGDNAVGGDVRIGAYNGATMSVIGNVSLSAGGFGFSAVDDGMNGGNGQGGTVLVQAAGGGTLSIGGSLTAAADGLGGDHGFFDGAAGDGRGGEIRILANDSGSSVTVSGTTSLSAVGIGGSSIECSTCSISGGYGEGGQIDVNGANGAGMTLTFGGNLFIDASGTGGSGDLLAAEGVGGNANLSAANGTTINVAGNLTIAADGSGGFNGGTGAGGNGTGGDAFIGGFNGPGGAIAIGGGIALSALGTGGGAAGAGAGGIGLGGNAFIHAPGVTVSAGANPDLSSEVELLADGEGGDSSTGTGGNGIGGNTHITTNGFDISLDADVTLSAVGRGGAGRNGGAGDGGTASIYVNNATVDLTGMLTQDANAFGGFSNDPLDLGLGGAAVGGNSVVFADNGGAINVGQLYSYANAYGGSGGTGGAAQGGSLANGGGSKIETAAGGAITIDFVASLSASAYGGTGYLGGGGNAIGGRVIAASRGAMEIGDSLNTYATGYGGSINDDGGSGGNGTGGQIDIFAETGGTLAMLSNVFADASGQGGSNFALTSIGGNGQGGIIYYQASNGSSVDATGFVSLLAEGRGGYSGGDCNLCGGAGGDGSGGDIIVQVYGGTNMLTFRSGLDLDADGIGSGGYGGPGGDGLGGDAYIQFNNAGTIDVAGNLTLSARGEGGYQSNGGSGGNGTGGNAAINLTATGLALFDVGGTTLLDTNGQGGGAGIIGGGTAGNGEGGWSRIFGTGGQADFTGNVSLLANGAGGDAFGGTGGNGVGGLTRVNSDGAHFDFAGDLSLAAISTGGDGMIGGDALAFIGAIPMNNATTDARILALNGTVTVLGTTSLNVSATGGSGSDGGAGGDASSGYVAVHARNSDLGPATITLGDLAINLSANGGAGGTGTSGNVGGNGGAGGSAIGGFAAPTASAGNGNLVIGNVAIDGRATGGAGGDGGNGDGGAGGNGGAGGAATGAELYIGTETGEAAALSINQGSASFASINAVLDATGGAGGDGASGATNGVGGAGGAAQGGDNSLAARGSLVTVGTATFTGHAIGGDGGLDPLGGASGVGGNATAGGLTVTVFNRANNGAMRGSLNSGAVSMTANAAGGQGSTDGLGYAGGRNGFIIRNSDVTMASFSMLNTGSSGGDPTAQLDPFSFTNSTVSVDGNFTVVDPTTVSLLAANSTVNLGNLSINAGNFIADFTLPAPTTIGTISADTIDLTSDQDVVVESHLVSGGGLTINVPGLIAIENASAADSIFLRANAGTIDAGNLSAGGFIDARSNGLMTLGNLGAGDYIDLRSDGGIAILDAISGESINFQTGGALSGANLTAGNSIAGQAIGAITLGTLSAGLVNPSQATGAEYSARLASDGAIATGSVSALGDIGFGTPLTLTTGNLSSGGGLMALVGGAMQLGAITTPGSGYVYLADYSMSGLGGTFDNFDRAPILASIPVASGGAITIGGNVATGSFQAAGASLSAQNIDAAGFVYVDVIGNFTANLIGASALDAYVGGNVDIDDTMVDESFNVEAGGTITAGNITAGDDIDLEAGGGVVTGNLSAGLVNPSTAIDAEYNVGVVSGTSISLGNVAAAGWVGIGTFGTVNVGTINSAGDVLILADGNITAGAVTTGADSRLLIAGAEMVEVGGGIGSFDRSIVFEAVDLGNGVATSGSVTLSAPVSTADLDILAGTNVTVGDLNLIGDATIEAGGLLTLNGDINSEVHFTSNDIAIANGVTISGGQLISSNAQGTFIGDGLAGQGGYRLSNAEYNSFNSVEVGANTALGAASTMTIGNLTVDGSNGSGWEFSVYNGDDETGAGTIAVLGDVLFTGLSSGIESEAEVDFTSHTLMVDANTGSISLEDASGGLAGDLDIHAQNVWIAESSILDQLAADPNYSALAAELAMPTATGAPDGIISASNIFVYLNDGSPPAQGATPAYSVYVQNTGTAQNRAGFVADYAEIFTAEGTPPGAIDMIVNGQVIVDGVTLTGVAVRDALVEVNDPARFTATSTINGCALTGACVIVLPPPPPSPLPPIQPAPDIATQISLINLPGADDLLFGNEEAIEDNEEDGGEDSESSPIQPPAPLFNTRPLAVPDETDEPVSGGGNPALIGNGPNPVEED